MYTQVPSAFYFFRDVLNFLRSGDLPPRERVRAVYKEAQYYSIGPLLDLLEELQPLKGEKVRQAFLGLMPYYKGKLKGWGAGSLWVCLAAGQKCF